MTRYEFNLICAKINQQKFWINPKRKGKIKATRMSESEFLKTMEIVNSIKK